MDESATEKNSQWENEGAQKILLVGVEHCCHTTQVFFVSQITCKFLWDTNNINFSLWYICVSTYVTIYYDIIVNSGEKLDECLCMPIIWVSVCKFGYCVHCTMSILIITMLVSMIEFL